MLGGTPRETGVVYERGDYAGFWRRVLIVVVDVPVLLGLYLFVAVPLRLADPPPMLIPGILIPAIGSYLIVPKAIGFGTLGYLAAGVRLVSLDGRPPSVPRLLVRTGILLVAPLVLVVDLIWLIGDERRQGFRDMWLGMYVIERGAEPISSGPVRDNLLFVMDYSIGFPEVVVRAPDPDGAIVTEVAEHVARDSVACDS